ncbi:MAG: TlpA family protein disulfide reductase [Saprospiraceae bacterium]|nr:TlpA family protein disulfide reductase [Saprospiraceae bacterium]MCB9324886.1 TlpA family protein disulfide reductase [Lewinellaceae bacterium]
MRLNKFLLAVLFLSTFSFSLFSQSDDQAVRHDGNQKLPDTEIRTLDGQVTNLTQYVGSDAEKGKITVISLWASWCKPCQTELDAIADLYDEWQEEYDMQLIAITIDTQRALAKVKPIVESKGWEYIILSDANQALKNTLNFQSIPHTLLVDQNGNIVDVHSGYSPGNEYELEDKIKVLFNQ